MEAQGCASAAAAALGAAAGERNDAREHPSSFSRHGLRKCAFVPQLYTLPKMPLHTSPLSAVFRVFGVQPPDPGASPGRALQNQHFEAVSHLNMHAQVQAKGELPATLIRAFPEISFFFL